MWDEMIHYSVIGGRPSVWMVGVVVSECSKVDTSERTQYVIGGDMLG